jgi:hypothetical protein
MAKNDEERLRGAKLDGSEQVTAVDHAAKAATSKPDAEVHVDGEDDSLYGDGLDIGDDSETLADTHGMNHRG